jgi:hypothetical protein
VAKVINTRVNIVVFEDHVWDLHDSGIKFDKNLEIDKLGWKPGDYFKLRVTEEGLQLVKISDLEKFIIKGRDHEAND